MTLPGSMPQGSTVVEPTTEVKTERSHKSQEISYRGRFADYKPDHVAPTTEVKTERSHESQEISYRGRFAIYTPVHVAPTTEVKTERSHESQEISYRGRFAIYTPVHVAPTTEVKTERSHESQEISYRGRFAIYTPVHVAPTTEVKTERSHESQEISYRGRFAIYTPVHVAPTTEVKTERSHESQEISYRGRFAIYTPVHVAPTTEVKTERSHESQEISYRGRFAIYTPVHCLSADGYFPVLGQCMNYIECHNNHGRVISCPSGLHFNFLLQTCDIPSKAGCEMKCKEPNGYFQFPGVCSYYLMCLDGTPFLKKCPGDLEFNEDTKQCDIVTKDHCMPYCPMENGIFPIDNHCDLYMRCTNGQPLVKRCPRGLHFNSLFKNCDLPENAKCIFPCPYPSGLFPIPGKSNKFLRCENGEATILTCAQGLHFNAQTRTCDWPPSAHCEISCPESDGYYPVQGACNAYVVCSEGRPTLKKCPYGKHFNLEAKRCDLPEFANCEFVCPGNDGLYSYRGHCDSYYHCENGRPALQC